MTTGEIDTGALQAMLDRHAIHEVILRFGRASDRADLAMLQSCYHPDAFEDHGYFRGNAWEFAEQAAALAADRHPDGGTHYLGTPFIELDGDRAYCETYVQAVMRTRDDGGRLFLIFSGRYLDTFERRDGEWKIAQRITVKDFASTERPEEPTWSVGDGREPVFVEGTQDGRDPVYALRDPAALRSSRRGVTTAE